MATTADYLTQLQADKQALVDNLVEKGVEATSDETFTSLVPKVLDIQSGGTELTKGFRIDSFDENGFATEITVVGMTALPQYYFYRTSYISGSKKSWATGANLKVNLPEGMTSIGNEVFNDNDGLVEINFPSTLTSIGQYAFYGCVGLINVEIPSGVVNLPYQGFTNSSNLTNVTALGDIKDVGGYCFSACRKLEKLIMPNLTAVPSLGNINAFGNTAIVNGTGYIYIPDNLVEEMKLATNWSTMADQIKGVSEL